jgi:hypothetical protein
MDWRQFDRWVVALVADHFSEAARPISRQVRPHRRDLWRAGAGAALATLLGQTVGSATGKRGRRKLTAECAGPPDTTTSFDDRDVRLAQTFTTARGGPLSRIRLTLHKEAKTEGDWLVRISPVDSAGRPTNEVLAEATIDDEFLPPGDHLLIVDFAKSKTAKLTEKTTYALVVSRPGACQIGLRTRAGDPCAGTFYASCRGRFQPVASVDLPLLAYVGFR